MPKHLADGFNTIQAPENLKTGNNIEVKYLPDVYGYGAKDIDWIPKVGKQKACVITQDINITRRKDELELYKKNNVGLFLLRGPSKKKGLAIMEMVEAIAKNWKEICDIAIKGNKPFAYTFTLRGKMKKLP
ncbi:hypothetical protein OOZ15_16025 [Galbibacter sp. EGI 63066]|uniref:PIN-like domain-containing protein n=1 Tax=Galbibacter sp. EGI 63066 TaxID=2993559 RepID=UPI00224965E2|nr:hypothetical protein [Galbibacter sp. EGI 63066]MCX2681463.1 hypothetical protein [Galbibacter sp. EGI 63066]